MTTSTRRITLNTQNFDQRPALDTAISRAMLQQVACGAEPETLRLFRPAAVVAFGPQDLRAPRFADAVEASHRHGFGAVNRLAGGRAAVFHEDTIGFAWTIRDDAPRDHVIERFEEIADIMAKALLRLGVDARVGEVAGEYCPGAYSVNARGATKLMGVGQRTILKAAHVGGVVVVGGSDRIRGVLVPVYDALDLHWNPDTTGSVQDEASVAYLDAQQAIVDEFASRYELAEGTLARDTVALAEELEPEHLAVLSPSR